MRPRHNIRICTRRTVFGMRKPELDELQRVDAARITAVMDHLDADEMTGTYLQALPDLRAISRDPVVLGDVLGDFLHRAVVGTLAETISYWPVLELLRAAGADEERAAAKATWLRQQGERIAERK